MPVMSNCALYLSLQYEDVESPPPQPEFELPNHHGRALVHEKVKI